MKPARDCHGFRVDLDGLVIASGLGFRSVNGARKGCTEAILRAAREGRINGHVGAWILSDDVPVEYLDSTGGFSRPR